MTLGEKLEQFKKEHRWDPEHLAEGYHLEIARQILEELDRREWSQGELAKRMEISASRLSQIFNQRSNVTLKTLAKLASALEMDWIFNLVPGSRKERWDDQQKFMQDVYEENHDTISDEGSSVFHFDNEDSTSASGSNEMSKEEALT